MMRAALPAALLTAALALTGCTASGAGIGAGTATALQQEVRHVAALAATHRYPAALTAAATLRSDLGAAVDTGRVPTGRAVRIRAALALVESDLRAAERAAKPSPSPTPTPTPTPTVTPKATPTPTSAAKAAPAKAAAPKAAPKPKPKPKPAPVRKWPRKHHGKWGRGDWGKGD